MTEAPVRGGPTLVGTTALAIYTAGGAGTWAIVREITLVNETTNVVTVSCGINTSAADAAGKRTFASSAQIQPGEAWDWAGMHTLNGHASTPDLVYVIASAAAAVTATVSAVTGP